ncbi:uncharacterized protein PS065_007838 [Dugong dugon]
MAAAGPEERAAKLAAVRARGPTGASARRHMPAWVRSQSSTVLPRCAGAVGTAVSRAKPASGTERCWRRRQAARRANGRAGAPVGGGCTAPSRVGVRATRKCKIILCDSHISIGWPWSTPQHSAHSLILVFQKCHCGTIRTPCRGT